MEGNGANITPSGLTPKGFVLPDGYSWDLQLENGMKDGTVKVKNKYGILFAQLKYCHDKLNGLCLFYNKGIIQKKRMYKDDVLDGWSCDCDKGKEVKWFLYEDGQLVSELVNDNRLLDYWKEIPVGTDSVKRICKYDENHVRNGKCYMFKDDRISKVVFYAKGIEIRIMKVFEDNMMKEFDDCGCLVYEGGYLDRIEEDYCRNGEGIEFVDNQCIYDGEWMNNKRNGSGSSLKNGVAVYNGIWKDGIPDGEGVLFNPDGDVLYDGEWHNGLYRINTGEYYDFVKGEIVKKEEEGNDPFVVTPQLILYYDTLFRSLDRMNHKSLNYTEVLSYHSPSGFSPSQLDKIYRISDIDHDGQLDFAEFVVFTHIVFTCRNGIPLPEELPASLIPPSKASLIQQQKEEEEPEDDEEKAVMHPRPTYQDSSEGKGEEENVPKPPVGPNGPRPRPGIIRLPLPSVGPIPRPSVRPIPRPSVGHIPRPSVGPRPRPSVGPRPRPSVGPRPRPSVGSRPCPCMIPPPRLHLVPRPHSRKVALFSDDEEEYYEESASSSDEEPQDESDDEEEYCEEFESLFQDHSFRGFGF